MKLNGQTADPIIRTRHVNRVICTRVGLDVYECLVNDVELPGPRTWKNVCKIARINHATEVHVDNQDGPGPITYIVYKLGQHTLDELPPPSQVSRSVIE